MLSNDKLKWNHVFNSIKNSLILLDANGKITNCNTAFLKIVNMTNEQVIGANYSNIIKSEDSKPEDCSYFKSKISKKRESSIIKIDDKWLKVDVDPILDGENEISGFVQFMSDITERKSVEETLKESEEILRLMIDNSPIGFSATDLEGNFIELNPVTCKTIGYTQNEMMHKHFDHFTHPDDIAKNKDLYQKLIKGEIPYFDLEKRYIHKNGKIIHVLLRSQLIHDDKGKPLFQFAITEDITERKLAEDALKKEKEYYHSFVTSLSDWVWEMDMNGIHTYSNLAVESILGYRVEDVVGHHVRELWGDSEITPKSLKMFNDTLSAGKGWKNVSGRFKHKNGSVIITESTASPIYNSENKLIGYRGIDHDVTERKRAGRIQEAIYNITNAAGTTDNLEKLISRIHKELGTIIDTTNFYIALYDNETDTFSLPFFTDVKDKINYFPAGKTLTNYVRKTQISLLANKKIMKKLEKYGEIELLGADSKVWLGVPLKVEGKITGVLAVQSYTDEFAYDESDLKMLEFISNQVSISIERKRTELVLKESEKRYKYLVNQTPVSIWEEDFSEVHRYLTSFKKSGIKDFKEYFENHLGEVKKCSEMVRILDINEMTVKLFNAKSKDDLITNLDSIFTKDSLSPFIDQLCAIAENHTQYTGETINKTLDGELLNVFIRWNVVPGYEKNYSRVLVSLMDITGQKKAEEGLRLGRERLKLLNQIIRHDLSNDFIVIKSAVNIFKRSSEVKMIDEIEKRADKSLATIDSYRKYESFIDSNADLNKIEVAELINDIIIGFPNIESTIEGKCNVFADDALTSIFTNLITNSIKHGNASEIDIKISTEKNMCKIKFMDNGSGIPDKIKGKIFNEEFFYGKAGYTGIGLHIVKKTIERYDGTISVEDNTPKGTVFIISLRKAL